MRRRSNRSVLPLNRSADLLIGPFPVPQHGWPIGRSALQRTGVQCAHNVRGILSLIAVMALVGFACGVYDASAAEPGLKAVLLAAPQATAERLRTLQAEGNNAVVLKLSATDGAPELAAAKRIQKVGLALYYWIEIGRSPALADAHPEWMASIQTHQEFRKSFPNLPPLKDGEVVKTYPWVPVLYQETFPVHLQHVQQLLADKPVPRGIFLNDLQAAPSACGCGHHLCRWTTDYGKILTATKLPADGAAKFVAAVKRLAPQAKVIPVWATECEEPDKDTLCNGVGCFNGACWKEFTAQLTPVAAEVETLAALLPYRALQRDLPHYGPTAGWITQALKSFSTMPARYQAKPVAPGRLIAVLQGWEVTPAQVQAQIARTHEAGAAGYVVSLMPIEQGWEPRIMKAVSSAQKPTK